MHKIIGAILLVVVFLLKHGHDLRRSAGSQFKNLFTGSQGDLLLPRRWICGGVFWSSKK